MSGDPARFEMDRLVSYDDQTLLEEVRRVSQSMPHGPLTRKAFDALARVSSDTLTRRFGGWQATLERAGLGDRYGGKRVSAKMRDQRGRQATQEDMVKDLQQVAARLGRDTLALEDYVEHSNLIGGRAVVSRFGSWRAALEAAGLSQAAKGRRWTDDDYFENLLQVWTHYGRSPTYAEMNLAPSRITNGGYAKKFGSWGRAKEAFVDRVNSDIERGTQVVETRPVTVPVSERPRQEDHRHIPIGLRYEVLRRDRFRCVACGRSPATDLSCVLHVDHVVAFSRGGKTRLDNLRALCADCNIGKAAT